MDELPRIREIDISRQARTLALLRLTDYALVVLCGFWALGIMSELLATVLAGDVGTYALELALMALLLCFAAYTGWRHVGVIDPAIWRAYDAVFPMLVLFCALVAWSLLDSAGSLADILEQERAVAIQELSGLFTAAWVAGISVLGWVALTMLRRMRIAELDATVAQVVSPLARSAGTSAAKGTGVRPVNRVRGLLIGGAGALLLLGFIFAPIPANEQLADAYLRSAQFINLAGFFLLVRARRYFQVDAESLLAVDRRAPILFLRSFDDDEKQKFGSSQRALLDFSLETRLSNHFFRFGPFVAVGSPKESVPQPGAARVLLGDDEWQGRVLGWMKSANLIIMYSGMTQWVNWELRQVLENGRATSLILMFPEIREWRPSRRAASVEARVEKIREVFADTPWKEELNAFSDFSDLRAMLFRADGSMVMIRSRSRSRDAYHLAALIAHRELLAGDAPPEVETAGEGTRRDRRSRITIGAVVGTVAILAAINLLRAPADSLLMFGQGGLHYGGAVSEAEARAVGEYLLAQEYFSDRHEATVQLHRDQDRYRLQFVIDPQYAEDEWTVLQFGMLGGVIGAELLGGNPLEVSLHDAQLSRLRSVPLTWVQSFRLGEVYYTEPVTPAEVAAVGGLLVQAEFFDDETRRTVGLTSDDGALQLKFVVNPSVARDAEVVSAFRELSGLIAGATDLGGRRLVFHLCDDAFRSLYSEPL